MSDQIGSARRTLVIGLAAAVVLAAVTIVVAIIGGAWSDDPPAAEASAGASAALSMTAATSPSPDAGIIADPESPTPPTDSDLAAVTALIAFAREPETRSLDEVPLTARDVALGLADQLMVARTREELVAPDAWWLVSEAFRGRVGPFSALETLRSWDLVPEAPVPQVSVRVGSHPHCASPPVPPPDGLENHRRLSIQPVGISSCIQWWTVDLFVNADGEIEAITLDLYEP